jgi:NAD-dependent aldehyde dehydrogenases
MSVRFYKNYINGEFVDLNNENFIDVYNPSAGEVIAKVQRAESKDVDVAIDAAREAFDSGRWSKLTPADRSNLLLKVADLLEKNKDEFIELETLNTGKNIRQVSQYDVPYTIDNIKFIAGACRILEGIAMGEYVSDGTSCVRREPIGVVGVITPWNYPLMMVVWRAFPALAMGNTVVVKPASWTPITTLKLAELMHKAGFPKGVFNVVVGPGNTIGEHLAKSKKVDMIAFTGSTEVGRRLQELGSSNLKKYHSN